MAGPEVLGRPKKVDRLTFLGKADMVKKYQDENASLDSLVLCLFSTFTVSKEIFADMLSAATGVDYSNEEYLKCGERIWNLERLFNNKAGFSRRDDTLRKGFLKQVGLTNQSLRRALMNIIWKGAGI